MNRKRTLTKDANVRKSKTRTHDRKVEPSTQPRCESDEFLWDLLSTVESLWHLSKHGKDLMPTVSNVMEARRSKIDLDMLRHLRLIGKHPRDQITYREVFRGLCTLCTKELTDHQKSMIYWMIEHSYYCEYQPFMRLTNNRHNPDRGSRRWAIASLALIAKIKWNRGEKHRLGRRADWKNGAIKRLRELHRSGAMAKDDIYPEQLGLQAIV